MAPSSPRSASTPGEAALAVVERAVPLLSRSLWPLDLRVTASEAGQVAADLGTLTPKDFADAVVELDRRGRLEALLDALDLSGREAFLELCVERGLAKREPARPPEPGVRLAPPACPALVRQDVKLPRPLNDAIFESAVRSAAAYRREYEAYLDRYERAVAACGTGAELRALGEVRQPELVGPPVDEGDPRVGRYRRDWPDDYPSALRAQRAVSARIDDILGEQHAGSFWFEGGVSVRLGAAQAEVALDTRRPIDEVTVRAAFVSKPVPGGKVELGSDGSVSAEAKASMGERSVGLGVTTREGRTEKVAVSVGRVGVSASADEVGLKLGSAYARGDGQRLAGGVELALEAPGRQLAGRAYLGAGLQGVTGAQALQALSRRGDGALRVPPELERGTSWAQLDAPVRTYLERNAWTEAEWRARLADRTGGAATTRAAEAAGRAGVRGLK